MGLATVIAGGALAALLLSEFCMHLVEFFSLILSATSVNECNFRVVPAAGCLDCYSSSSISSVLSSLSSLLLFSEVDVKFFLLLEARDFLMVQSVDHILEMSDF